jgi:lipopolysaccharide biosynthesis regulator YciM
MRYYNDNKKNDDLIKQEKKYYECQHCHGITTPFVSMCPFCNEWGSWKPVLNNENKNEKQMSNKK